MEAVPLVWIWSSHHLTLYAYILITFQLVKQEMWKVRDQEIRAAHFHVNTVKLIQVWRWGKLLGMLLRPWQLYCIYLAHSIPVLNFSMLSIYQSISPIPHHLIRTPSKRRDHNRNISSLLSCILSHLSASLFSPVLIHSFDLSDYLTGSLPLDTF